MSEDRRRSPRRGHFGVGLLLLTLLAGCNPNLDYLIWPTAARTGDTVAVLFNTEWDTYSDPGGALLDASVANIVVQVSDSQGWTEPITPRFVIEAPAALGSKAVVGPGLESFTGLVAIFDLPDPWPNGAISFPNDFTVAVEYQGAATFGGNHLLVTGTGGSPIEFSYNTPVEMLELHPMLRLRPAWNGGTGFDPAWEIGGIEFTLRYTPPAVGDVSNLRALANGEATAGLATATELAPQGGDKRWRIVLVHPPGFQLPDRGCEGPGECFSGRWALLDLPLAADETGLLDGAPAFLPEQFAIEDLRIVDRDGALLAAVTNADEFFHKYAANNTVPVPEPGMILLLTSGVLGLAVLHRVERRRQARASRDER